MCVCNSVKSKRKPHMCEYFARTHICYRCACEIFFWTFFGKKKSNSFFHHLFTKYFFEILKNVLKMFSHANLYQICSCAIVRNALCACICAKLFFASTSYSWCACVCVDNYSRRRSRIHTFAVCEIKIAFWNFKLYFIISISNSFFNGFRILNIQILSNYDTFILRLYHEMRLKLFLIELYWRNWI